MRPLFSFARLRVFSRCAPPEETDEFLSRMQETEPILTAPPMFAALNQPWDYRFRTSKQTQRDEKMCVGVARGMVGDVLTPAGQWILARAVLGPARAFRVPRGGAIGCQAQEGLAR